MEAWLRTHEVEETTRASYEQYARVHLYLAFGALPVGKVSARLLEEFYADLWGCAGRCDGRAAIEHRSDRPHECRLVKHRRSPGRPPATRRTTATRLAVRSSDASPTSAGASPRRRSGASISPYRAS
jgi:hypothetical protein